MRPVDVAKRGEWTVTLASLFAGTAESSGPPHPRPFLAELTVGEEHLSRGVPHANNAEYVRWIDRIAELHADEVGFGRAELIARGRAWFIARHEIEYRAECWLHEELILATWVRAIQRTTCLRETRIVRPSDRRLIASASTRWVHIDLASRRPVRVEESARSAFEPLEETLSGDALRRGPT